MNTASIKVPTTRRTVTKKPMVKAKEVAKIEEIVDKDSITPLPDLRGPFFTRVSEGRYRFTDSGKRLLKLLDLKHLSSDYAGYSAAVFHQYVNNYVVGKQRVTKEFNYPVMLAFKEALRSYLIQLNSISTEMQHYIDEDAPHNID